MKPKVGFFDFTCCEGCQLTVLSVGDRLLDLVSSLDVVNFREASSEVGHDYDIAFIEGSVAKPADVERLKEIRKNARICVALGACAHIAGVNAMRNFHNQAEVKKNVYGEKAWIFDTLLAQPIDAVIKVEYFIPGCPVDKEEVLRAIAAVAAGLRPYIPDHPVCVECKMRGNVCLYHKTNKIICMGPVTRAGCRAACPSVGNACEGCRGLVSDPNIKAFEEVLAEHGVSPEDRMKFYRMYNGLMGVR